MLLTKHKRALVGHKDTLMSYQGLSDSLDEQKLTKWRASEKEAMEKRGEYLRIFEVQTSKGIACLISFIKFSWLIPGISSNSG